MKRRERFIRWLYRIFQVEKPSCALCLKKDFNLRLLSVCQTCHDKHSYVTINMT